MTCGWYLLASGLSETVINMLCYRVRSVLLLSMHAPDGHLLGDSAKISEKAGDTLNSVAGHKSANPPEI